MADTRPRSRPDDSAERPPWKVDGERPAPDGPASPSRRMPRMPGGRRIWQLLLALLVLNFVLVQLLPSSAEKRIDVPYTFFREQVSGGNVTEVNAKGDVIQGEF